MKFTLGCDPEFFIAQGGEFVSAYGLVPGTKEQPQAVPKGAVQVDGVAVEFNTDPAHSLAEFKDNLNSVFGYVKGLLAGYTVLEDVTVSITEAIRKKTPANSLIIGCSPDVNAYTEGLNPSPDSDTPFRSVGGHLHIGGFLNPDDSDFTNYKAGLRLARLLDKHVGVYSVLWDSDAERRKIYGCAGACRPKEYGVEYRTLSNRWLFLPPVQDFLYQGIELALADFAAERDVGSEVYRKTINAGDAKSAVFLGDPRADFVKQLL